MNREARRGVRTWLTVGSVLITLLYTGWLIYLLRANASGLVWIASLLLSIPIIFTVSVAIENGLQRISGRWGDKEFSAEGQSDDDAD